MIKSMLMALKLGLFLPNTDAPFDTWFYLSTNLVPVAQTWNIEGGYTLDMVERPMNTTVNGRKGTRIIYTPAYVLNVVKVINKDADLGLGVRYRSFDRSYHPHMTLSFKFNSIVSTNRNAPTWRPK